MPRQPQTQSPTRPAAQQSDILMQVRKTNKLLRDNLRSPQPFNCSPEKMAPNATLPELLDGLKSARRIVMAFQERFQSNPTLTARASRIYGQLTGLQSHIQRTINEAANAAPPEPAPIPGDSPVEEEPFDISI